VIGDPRGRPSEHVTATGGRALLAAVLARTVERPTDDAAVAAELDEGLDDVRRDLEALIGRGLLTGAVVRAFAEGAPLRVTEVELTAEGRRVLGASRP
jgi:hypothetical protein